MAKWSFKKMAENILIEQLCADGERIMRECLSEVDYTHRTHNLEASYGWAVCRRGKIIRTGYPSTFPTEAKNWYGEMMYGGDALAGAIDEYEGKYKPLTKTFELVIIAAMPYAEVLENASSGQHRKYKVISMAADKLRALQAKYGGASVRAVLRGQRV